MQTFMLVAGGAGFIGSHLCERLLAAGHDVLVLDNFSTGRRKHLAWLDCRQRLGGRLKVLAHDVTEPLPSEVQHASRLFNLACPASPAHYQARPVQTVLASALGGWRLLEAARSSGARLLQASTSEIYGDPQQHPQTESYWGHVNPNGPRACYDEGKRCTEAMAAAYEQQYRVQVRVARIFNTYGPRLRPGDGRVVSNFIVRALLGEPLTIYGDGSQTRSFCYVDDTVEALLRLMDSGDSGPVNIGNPVETSVLELAETVLRLCASASTLVRLPLPIDDPVRRCPDIARARRTLAWEPRIALEDGLRSTIDYFRFELGTAGISTGQIRNAA